MLIREACVQKGHIGKGKGSYNPRERVFCHRTQIPDRIQKVFCQAPFDYKVQIVFYQDFPYVIRKAI